jgi:AcrR family transcriptional regulator
MEYQNPDSSDRRAQIAEAALRVFSTKGFQRATNKDIAEEAGISPGLIYHYYKDKEDLFLSLFRDRAAIVQLADHPEELMSLPPREGLYLIGSSYLKMLAGPGNTALFRILISEVLRFPQISEMLYKLVISRIFAVIRDYLNRQIELGRLRPHNTDIATRSFIGAFVVHILAREVLRQPEAREIGDATVLSTVIDIFLRGLEAEAC